MLYGRSVNAKFLQTEAHRPIGRTRTPYYIVVHVHASERLLVFGARFATQLNAEKLKDKQWNDVLAMCEQMRKYDGFGDGHS